MFTKLLNNKPLIKVLAVTWTVIIFIGCSLPGKDLPAITLFDHFDKLVHFVFFFVFAFLWLVAYNKFNLKRFYIIVFLSFIYGFLIEVYQVNFVIGRSWDVWDGVADGIGGGVGAIVYRFLQRVLSKRDYISN